MSDTSIPAGRPVSANIATGPGSAQENTISSPLAPRIVQKMPEPREWNTKHLGLRLCADLASAASAAVLVAPIITMIDKCVSL